MGKLAQIVSMPVRLAREIVTGDRDRSRDTPSPRCTCGEGKDLCPVCRQY